MDELYKKINKLWRSINYKYYWGDPLDVRYYLCKQISELKNKKILDVGCNAGIIMHCLDKTNEITGIEINKNAIAMAQAINPTSTIIMADMFAIPLKMDYFDVIILANIFPKHDFPSSKTPEELVQYLKRFLKRGGKFFITTPNSTNAYYKKGIKFIDHEYLKKLFSDSEWETKIYGWNPFPIQSNHLLKFIPGIFNIIEWLSKKKLKPNRYIALYAKATKK